MSLFKPEAPPAPKPRQGPPPPKKKPVIQPEFDPNPPLTRVAKGEVCYIKVRVTQSTMDFSGPEMEEKPMVWVEIMHGDDVAVPGRTDCVAERWLVSQQQIMGEVRKAMERGAA